MNNKIILGIVLLVLLSSFATASCDGVFGSVKCFFFGDATARENLFGAAGWFERGNLV